MAKRTIIECDLTKQEVDPDDLVTIEIKKKGKRTGRKYEISAEAAAKLEQQLVAGSTLGKDWYFATGPIKVSAEWDKESINDPPPDNVLIITNSTQEPTDESWVAAKKAELKENGIVSEEEEQAPRPTKAQNECIHMNKGPLRTTIRNNERYAYRLCKECGKQVPEKRLKERAEYLSAKPPADVNIRDYGE